MEPVFELWVCYSLKRFAWGELDGKLRRCVGRSDTGSGTAMNERDLSFTFKTRSGAERAQSRVRDAFAGKVETWITEED